MKSILLASITAISIFAAVSLGAQASLPAGFSLGAQASLPAGFSLGAQASLPAGFRQGLIYEGKQAWMPALPGAPALPGIFGGEKNMNSTGKKEVATLAGGCFWCLEAVYNDLRGVEKVVSGYSGGRVANPSYEQVCTGKTGHAEVIQITFDPQVISFKELLDVFFTIHDPTTLNRQGADVGTQYRSAIFYHSPEQKEVAGKVIADITAAKIWKDSIVTEVTKLDVFYPAEEYHQRFYERNPNQGYCRMVIEPKVIKFRRQFMSKLKKQPAASER